MIPIPFDWKNDTIREYWKEARIHVPMYTMGIKLHSNVVEFQTGSTFSIANYLVTSYHVYVYLLTYEYDICGDIFFLCTKNSD